MAIGQDNAPATDADDRTKPPFLRRVRIQGYKSIAFCDVVLQPLTILVGRNASGKSNFLDALAFLRDVVVRGLQEAIHLHGGRKAILHRSSNGTTVSIYIQIGYQEEKTGCDHFCNYYLEIALPLKSKPVFLIERGRINRAIDGRIIGFDRAILNPTWTGSIEGGDESPERFEGESGDRSVLDLPASILKEMRNGLAVAGFYNFSPEAIRELQKPEPGNQLKRDGRNLASVLEGIRESDPESLGRIKAYLSAIVDEVNGFEVVPYGDYETVRFQLRSKGAEGKPIEFDASSMSDGTLRALAALVAAFQNTSGHGPSVIGIEEPETALHPAAMRALVDALEEATG